MKLKRTPLTERRLHVMGDSPTRPNGSQHVEPPSDDPKKQGRSAAKKKSK
ncbi:hypothetical protein ACFFK0_21200 [Paenibacillus chartarius]|uniref:Small acid-soluble spore protein P n=1 Tax=Paenibacillus chartarius TaxID=747481 RepID=A0ABV6DQL4_9BACL